MILATPAAVKVGVMFAAILVFSRLGLSLGLSIVLSAVGLVVWSGAGLAGAQFQLVQFLQADNLLLLLVILCLLFFTEALTVSGRIERTIESLRARLKSARVLVAGVPALIGLLPMPGGALVSAPLVGSIDKEGKLSPDYKVAVNYWFRHVWECWWPLYPGVVLAIKYSEMPMMLYYGLMMPMTAASLAGGYFFILRRLDPATIREPGESRSIPGAWAALLPIAILVTFSLAGAPLLVPMGVARTTANLIAMFAGLLVALSFVFAGSPTSIPKASRMLVSGKTWGLILVVAGVQMFAAALKCPLDASGVTLVASMGHELLSVGIPVVLVMIAVPFIAGMVTGVALGFVGVSFPLVFGLLGPSPDLAHLASTTMLAYTAGYIGMMLSPIHVCFVVTCEYFKVKALGPAYRYLIGPVGVVFVVSLALAGLYLVAL